MASCKWKMKYKLLIIFFLFANNRISQAQYIIEGAKYRSIRDSLLNFRKSKQLSDSITSISMSGEIQRTSSIYRDPNSLLWTKMQPLISKFQGKKIKKILTQNSSGKAMIFLSGNNITNTTIDSAINAGLLMDTYSSISQIIKNDTPLNIGEKLLVNIRKQHPDNNLVAVQSGIKSTQLPDRYELQSYLPGDIWILETAIDGKTERVYSFHSINKTDKNNKQPDFFLGEIKSNICDYNLFKQQNIIKVTNGYHFLGGTLYFLNPGARNVIQCTIKDSSLAPAKIFIDHSLPGTQIMFDNISLSDSTGKKIMHMGRSYTLIDSLDIRESYLGLITSPDFPGGDLGLIKYVVETLIRLPDVGLMKGKFDLNFSFVVNTDGTLTEVFGENFYSQDKIRLICYNLIKNSSGWIPGTYKGKSVSMISSLHFSIEIK